MSTRQYIGARYVPKFMGEYDPTAVYEALSVVDNGQGTSYISKIPTPAGTALTDRTYWQMYGATSGAIINLQSQIDDMKDGNVSGSLQNQINTANSDIENLDNTVSLLSNRKYVFIGDSYGESYSGITGWADKIAGIMGIQPTDIAESFAESGYGFIGNNGKTWLSIISNYGVDNTVTDVVFVGGTNDVNENASDLATAINNTISVAKTKYPNAKIWVGFCSMLLYPSDILTALYLYNNISTYYGAVFMGSLQYCLYNPNYRLNDDHPNNAGTDALASAISTILKGGEFCNTYPSYDVNPSASALVTVTPTSFKFNFAVLNNWIKLVLSGLNNNPKMEFTGSVAGIKANGYSPVALAYFPNLTFGSGKHILGSVSGAAIWQTLGVHQADFDLYFDNYVLYATVSQVKDDRTGFYNVDQADTLTGIQINAATFYIPVIK